MDARKCYFVMETQKDENGYIPLIAVEGEKGYYMTNWRWNCSFEVAQSLCDKKNAALGIEPKESVLIVVSTMKK